MCAQNTGRRENHSAPDRLSGDLAQLLGCTKGSGGRRAGRRLTELPEIIANLCPSGHLPESESGPAIIASVAGITAKEAAAIAKTAGPQAGLGRISEPGPDAGKLGSAVPPGHAPIAGLDLQSAATGSAKNAGPPVPAPAAGQPPESQMPEAGLGSATVTEAAGTPSAKAAGSANIAEPSVEPAAETAEPEFAPQGSRSAPIAEPEIQPQTTEITAAGPGTATMTPTVAIISVLQNLQSRVLQTLQNHPVAPALTATPEGPEPQPEAGSPLAATAEPKTSSAPEDPPTAAALEDSMAAAMHLLLRRAPTAPEIRDLQDVVPDQDTLLKCLAWMSLRPGELYADAKLLASQVGYYCLQSGGPFPSPFLDDLRRRK